jgi:hypothetical protein
MGFCGQRPAFGRAARPKKSLLVYKPTTPRLRSTNTPTGYRSESAIEGRVPWEATPVGDR